MDLSNLRRICPLPRSLTRPEMALRKQAPLRRLRAIHDLHAMIIGVAGPYSAATEAQRNANLLAMNAAAARLLEQGHIPVIGMNAALPVVEQAEVNDPYGAVMAISLAVIGACDALLLIGESPGANKERDLIVKKGGAIYTRIEDVPAA